MNKFFTGILLFTGYITVGCEYAHSGSLSPVSIRFSDQVTVDVEDIRLGDLARVLAGEAKVVAELETLVVAKAAGFGLTRVIDTDYLYTRYLKGFGSKYLIDFDRKAIRVTTRAQIFPSDSLAPLIDAFLAGTPKLTGEIRHWEIARAPTSILVPFIAHTLELSFLGVKRKGKVDLNLAIRTEAKILRNITIAINLRIEQPVLVATKQIDRDNVISRQNVSLETRETTLMNDVAVIDPKKLLGLLAKVTIIPGRVITPRMVAIPPTVKRGQEAKIVFQNGSVSVSSDAVCRQDGVVGQIITAKNLANNRLVRVRVTEGGRLEPIPGG
jgi:flagellar basal body P-ring formation protein FlgA